MKKLQIKTARADQVHLKTGSAMGDRGGFRGGFGDRGGRGRGGRGDREGGRGGRGDRGGRLECY